MKSRKIAALALTGVMVAISLSGCGASDKKASEASQASSTTDSNKKVLRVGMECAYAPFNWTQDTDTTLMEVKQSRFTILIICIRIMT